MGVAGLDPDKIAPTVGLNSKSMNYKQTEDGDTHQAFGSW